MKAKLIRLGHLAHRNASRAAVGAGAALASLGAFAQAADPLTVAQAATDTAKTNGTTIALSLLSFAVAVWGIFAIIKFFGKR